MLSRVANAIYWSSRYLERAENISRIAYVNLHYGLGNAEENHEHWFSLIKATGDEKFFFKKYKKASYENILKFLVTDKSNFNSIYSCIRAGRENARTVREIISAKMWEDINQLYWSAQEFVKKRSITNNIEDFLRGVQDRYMSYLGATESTMNHNEAWHFSRLGRMIERGDKTGRILDVQYFSITALETSSNQEAVSETLLAKSLLKSTSAFEVYRQNYSDILPENVGRFLMTSPTFPRSIYYCALQMAQSIESICEYNRHPRAAELRNLAEKLSTFVKSEGEKEFSSSRLHQFIDEFQKKANEIDAKIFEVFFSTEIKPDSFRAYEGQLQTQL